LGHRQDPSLWREASCFVAELAREGSPTTLAARVTVRVGEDRLGDGRPPREDCMGVPPQGLPRSWPPRRQGRQEPHGRDIARREENVLVQGLEKGGCERAGQTAEEGALPAESRRGFTHLGDPVCPTRDQHPGGRGSRNLSASLGETMRTPCPVAATWAAGALRTGGTRAGRTGACEEAEGRANGHDRETADGWSGRPMTGGVVTGGQPGHAPGGVLAGHGRRGRTRGPGTTDGPRRGAGREFMAPTGTAVRDKDGPASEKMGPQLGLPTGVEDETEKEENTGRRWGDQGATSGAVKATRLEDGHPQGCRP